jgi:hypothetical protein
VKFARWAYAAAGVYGVLTLPPLYFVERMVQPPPNHPEYYYGFVGCGLAFQILFLLIARDPVRLRPAMPACMLEKATFVVALTWLYRLGRVTPVIFGLGMIDLVWLALFVAAWRTTPGA